MSLQSTRNINITQQSQRGASIQRSVKVSQKKVNDRRERNLQPLTKQPTQPDQYNQEHPAQVQG